MNQPLPSTVTRPEERTQRKTERREAKKMAIAMSALDALKRMGYANTTMRDIAAVCEMSLGSLTYYFIDKEDLITWCVRLYKTEFIQRISRVADAQLSPQGVIAQLADELARSILEDRATHRLWYDIRNQAMFDPTFLPVVSEIEHSLQQVLSEVLRTLGVIMPHSAALGYAMLDGVYRFLLQNTQGKPQNEDSLSEQFRAALQAIISLKV
ncbi:TetR family transcriptional regulator [Enterobacteriaceae bacterium RIT691]|nr:TetR family transcriptional regulator [Enterobacteriaceae bacterium RIT691]